MAAWIAALVALVTLAAGLIVERGAVWVLAATVAGFACVVLVGSGVLRRWRGSPTPPSAG
jgi:hypothetical protein